MALVIAIPYNVIGSVSYIYSQKFINQKARGSIMEKMFKITDEDGIHARPATALVNTANKFKGAESFAEAGGKKVTLKSILGVLSLGLEQGDSLKLIVEGEEAAEALQALTEVMVNEGLGEVNA
ncbi:hypothetical protein J53TS2_40140 [Paenibacillus sp. J53TS2]|nr:hypothetical protein J53TS2_40140 [Paenibacillus sp. J53TS2]